MGGAGLLFGLMFVVLLVLLVLGIMGALPGVGRVTRNRRAMVEAHDEALVYEVPEGQDPAAVVTALRRDGLEAVEVMRQGRQRIVVSGPDGGEALRTRARAVIAGAARNYQGDPAEPGEPGEVRFIDE